MFLSLCYVVLQRVLELAALRFRSNDFKELEIIVLRHELAMTRWVRIVSNLHLGAYEVFEATAALPEPEWPVEGFEHIFGVAFKDYYIDSVNHPAVRRLRGDL